MSTDTGKHRKRNYRLDIFKGVLIFLVVFGHFLLPVKEREYALFNKLFFFIYSFHMPAFIFLSGYLYYDSWKRKGTKLKSVIPLIMLFLMMKILLHISDLLFYGDRNIIPDFLHESSTPWYISALIFFRLSLYPLELFLKLNKKKLTYDAVTIYVTVLTVFFTFFSMLNMNWQVRIDDFLSLDRVVSFAPYFYIGILYKKYSSVSKTSIFEEINMRFFGIGAFCVLGFLVFFKYTRFYTLIFYGPWGYRIAERNILPIFKGVLNPLRIIYMLYALSTSYFIFVVTSLKKNFLTNILKRFGVYSLPIFAFHRIIRDAFSHLLLDNFICPVFGKITILIILLTLSFLTCMILGNDNTNRFCRFK
ncbi:acyltransferase family protein [Lachnoanaerobaculum gingivalis]